MHCSEVASDKHWVIWNIELAHIVCHYLWMSVVTQNHASRDMKVCPYNAKHVHPAAEHQFHLVHCVDRNIIDRDIIYGIFELFVFLCPLWVIVSGYGDCKLPMLSGYFAKLVFNSCTSQYFSALPSVLWRCWLGGRKGIRPVKNWVVRCWRGYLSAARCRLAYAQLMPLPLTVSLLQ